MTMALGIIIGTSVPLYVNKVTKYSQERDGCHYLSILGIAVAQASCVVRVWKISNKFSISRITHLVGYCSQSVTSGCKPQPPGAGQVGGWARQERQVERSRTTSPDHRCWGERISNNNACSSADTKLFLTSLNEIVQLKNGEGLDSINKFLIRHDLISSVKCEMNYAVERRDCMTVSYELRRKIKQPRPSSPRSD